MTKKIYRSVWFASVCFFLLGVVSAHAQTQLIKGKIAEVTGSPVPGVNIILKGTSVGTTSDANGEFSLQASTSDVLVISFIGYQTQEVEVGTQTQINVVLQEDVSTLTEVVVVGYGEQKKKLV